MPESSGEQPAVTPTETPKREEDPLQEVAKRVKAGILGPLSLVKLPEDKVRAIQDYAEMAAQAAVEETRRLQIESPLELITEALKEQLLKKISSQGEEYMTGQLRFINDLAERWRERFKRELAKNAMMGESKSPQQIVEELIKRGRQKERSQPQGIIPEITVTFHNYFLPGATMSEVEPLVEEFLKKLGFIPEEGSLVALYDLTSSEMSSSEKEAAMWGGKPIRSGESVYGLTSEKMPGTAVELYRDHEYERVLINIHLNDEAVLRCIPEARGVKT